MIATQSVRGTRIGLGLVIGGAVAVGDGYVITATGGTISVLAPWMLAIGSASASVGLFVLGAASRGVLSRGVAAVLALLFAVIVAGFGAALLLPSDEGAAGRLLLGIPLRLAVVFYGVGLLPLFVLPLVFAVTFGTDDTSEESGR